MTDGYLVESITRRGQKFIDEPVYREVTKATKCALAVNLACIQMALERFGAFWFGGFKPSIVAPHIEPVIQTISHFERKPLRWVKLT